MEEMCPYCDLEFVPDAAAPEGGQIACPDCGGLFDSMYDNSARDSFMKRTMPEAVEFERAPAAFDKFMGRILQEEKRSGPAVVMTDSPQRLRAARHQERPLGRTRIGFAR